MEAPVLAERRGEARSPPFPFPQSRCTLDSAQVFLQLGGFMAAAAAAEADYMQSLQDRLLQGARRRRGRGCEILSGCIPHSGRRRVAQTTMGPSPGKTRGERCGCAAADFVAADDAAAAGPEAGNLSGLV